MPKQPTQDPVKTPIDPDQPGPAPTPTRDPADPPIKNPRDPPRPDIEDPPQPDFNDPPAPMKGAEFAAFSAAYLTLTGLLIFA
ncbi:hypothetical protein [Terrarubrum flagellatum]|uniref:hypothetical protein n=1 Tax=Terrirubrum flagellatum TaxID=2895980 RepID=UPI003144EB9C